MFFRYSLSLSSLDTPSPNLSVSLEVCNCQIQRLFGWWYANGRDLLMFSQLHVYLIIIIITVVIIIVTSQVPRASCFAMVSSPAFSVSMLGLFPLLSHFSFSSAQLSLPMPLVVVLLRGLFVLLQLGPCHIILSIILLIVPWSYIVIGSLCLVCPVVLSSVFA